MAGKKKYVNPNNSASHSIIQNSKKSKDGYSSKLFKYVKMEHASKKKQDKLNKVKLHETQYQKKIFFDDETNDGEYKEDSQKKTLDEHDEFFEELDILDRTKKYISKLKNVPTEASSNLGSISVSNEWYFFGPASQCRSTDAKNKYIDLAFGIDVEYEVQKNQNVPDSIPHVSEFHPSSSHPKQKVSCNGCGETFESFPGNWISVAPIGVFHTRCANLL